MPGSCGKPRTTPRGAGSSQSAGRPKVGTIQREEGNGGRLVERPRQGGELFVAPRSGSHVRQHAIPALILGLAQRLRGAVQHALQVVTAAVARHPDTGSGMNMNAV